MCGICGFVDFAGPAVEKDVLLTMTRTLQHRGPDDQGITTSNMMGFGHTRLSIIDPTAAGVFARLPEHKVTSTRTTVRISVEVNKPLVCIADYEEITTALSGLFELPKAALVYAGCSKAPLVLCWLASHELVAYFKLTGRVLSGHRLLAENKVTRLAVGDQIYKCPTIKVRAPWSEFIVYMSV